MRRRRPWLLTRSKLVASSPWNGLSATAEFPVAARCCSRPLPLLALEIWISEALNLGRSGTRHDGIEGKNVCDVSLSNRAYHAARTPLKTGTAACSATRSLSSSYPFFLHLSV